MWDWLQCGGNDGDQQTFRSSSWADRGFEGSWFRFSLFRLHDRQMIERSWQLPSRMMTPQVWTAAVLYQTLTQRRWYSSGHAVDSVSAAYARLGLPVNASLDEVKGAYRRLALQCHPDLNKKDSQEFVRITAAYERILNKSSVYSSTTSRPRRYAGSVVYARSSPSTFTPKAAAVWGFGLAMGCAFFGAVLLWARAELVQSALHRKGPSRVVEPTNDALKRERIQALLMEKSRVRDVGKDK